MSSKHLRILLSFITTSLLGIWVRSGCKMCGYCSVHSFPFFSFLGFLFFFVEKKYTNILVRFKDVKMRNVMQLL